MKARDNQLQGVTSRVNICVALREQFNFSIVKMSAIKKMEKAYCSTQIAIISFTAAKYE